MGYYSDYSDVAIECGQKAYKMISEAAETNHFSPTETLANAEANTIIMHWKWVRWYKEHKAVKAISAILDVLDEFDKEVPEDVWDYSYKLIRLGNDPEGDLEIQYNDNGYYLASISGCGLDLDSDDNDSGLRMVNYVQHLELQNREIWLEGYFTETAAKAICAKMEGKTFYNFHCKYSNHAGNCRIGIEVNHIDTDDTIKEMFYFAALGELAKT